MLLHRYQRAKSVIQERIFFISFSGLIGMAPTEAKVRDEIRILLGCSFPVILRPHNNGEYYTVIEEPYVDGCADGKAIEKLEEGK